MQLRDINNSIEDLKIKLETLYKLKHELERDSQSFEDSESDTSVQANWTSNG